MELHDLEEEEEKGENGEGPKKKKPKTYHGSLALKDLHAASRYFPYNYLLIFLMFI